MSEYVVPTGYPMPDRIFLWLRQKLGIGTSVIP